MAKSKHEITWLDSGSEHVLTFEYRPGRPAVMYLRNGDPGYPADPDEIELVSIRSDTIVTDELEDRAQEWLSNEGREAALEIVFSER